MKKIIDLKRKLFFLIPFLSGILCFIGYYFVYEHADCSFEKNDFTNGVLLFSIFVQIIAILCYFSMIRDIKIGSKKENNKNVMVVIGIQLLPVLVISIIFIYVCCTEIYKYFKTPLVEKDN